MTYFQRTTHTQIVNYCASKVILQLVTVWSRWKSFGSIQNILNRRLSMCRPNQSIRVFAISSRCCRQHCSISILVLANCPSVLIFFLSLFYILLVSIRAIASCLVWTSLPVGAGASTYTTTINVMLFIRQPTRTIPFYCRLKVHVFFFSF